MSTVLEHFFIAGSFGDYLGQNIIIDLVASGKVSLNDDWEEAKGEFIEWKKKSKNIINYSQELKRAKNG